MQFEFIKEKKIVKNFILEKEEIYKNVKKEINDLNTERTIKILLKNNLINVRDNIKYLINSYKIKNIFEKIKTNKKRKQFEIISILKYILIKSKNERKIQEYKKETENLIDISKMKNELLKTKLNCLKSKDDSYQNKLDTYRQNNRDLIKRKIDRISHERDKLNKSREKSDLKIKRFETLINQEIDSRRNLLRNYSYKNMNFKMNKYNNIQTINI